MTVMDYSCLFNRLPCHIGVLCFFLATASLAQTPPARQPGAGSPPPPQYFPDGEWRPHYPDAPAAAPRTWHGWSGSPNRSNSGANPDVLYGYIQQLEHTIQLQGQMIEALQAKIGELQKKK
jgi:hypothetical protein